MPITATIRAGEHVSDNIELGPYRAAGLQLPDDWTAAVITFDFSPDGKVFGPAFTEDGTSTTELTIQQSHVVAGRVLSFVGDMSVAFADTRAFRIRSGAFGDEENQSADRVFTVFVVPR